MMIDTQKNVVYPYEVTGMNKKSGEFVLVDKPVQSVESQGRYLVAVSLKDYNYLNFLWKRYFWNVSQDQK